VLPQLKEYGRLIYQQSLSFSWTFQLQVQIRIKVFTKASFAFTTHTQSVEATAGKYGKQLVDRMRLESDQYVLPTTSTYIKMDHNGWMNKQFFFCDDDG
jgi:hypothetical protein